MSLNVVSVESGGSRTQVVTLESDSFIEASSLIAKKSAMEAVSDRINIDSCAITNSEGPYVVNEEGEEVDTSEKFNELVKEGAKYKYHIKFHLTKV